MTESIGNLYPTKIPALSEAADIQTALKVYHYGTATVPTQTADILPESIAGYLKSLNAAVAALTPAVTQDLGADENLNAKTTAGLYSQISSTDARTAGSYNYPKVGGLAYAGILTVVVAENVIFQTYQMESVDSTGAAFWRSRNTAGTWSSWKQNADLAHTHDDRYYTETELQVSGLSSIHPDNLNATVPVAKGGTGGTTKITARTGIGIFVADPANGTPTGAVAGDIWLW